MVRSAKGNPSILSIFDHVPGSFIKNENIETRLPSTNSLDFRWYLDWLSQQVRNLPECVFALFKEQDRANILEFTPSSILCRIFIAVNRYARETESPGIDDIIEHLQEQNIFCLVGHKTTLIPAQRLLIFAILGWQTMLYLPSFNTCPLSHLEIHQENGQRNSQLVYDTFKVSADLADRPMAILLKGYGNLLPARCQPLSNSDSVNSWVESTWTPISSKEMNICPLVSFLNVGINWVESLALHLDYDKASRTLSLFKYPSLCLATIETNGALYAFASPDPADLDPRADFDTITEILREILLSYRLLFGQKRVSRNFFRRLAKSEPSLLQNPDAFLHSICTTKLFFHMSVPHDQLVYRADSDFPVLGERLKLLQKELRGTKPKNWRDLIRDKRDTTQYWTFWLVAIFGTGTLILSLLQVIFSGLSLPHS